MIKYVGSLIRFELTLSSTLDKIEVKYSIICLNSNFYQYSIKLFVTLARCDN